MFGSAQKVPSTVALLIARPSVVSMISFTCLDAYWLNSGQSLQEDLLLLPVPGSYGLVQRLHPEGKQMRLPEILSAGSQMHYLQSSRRQL